MNSKEVIKNIQKIYDQLPIPKHLQKHMIRVAAVGRFLCTKIPEKVDTEKIEAALLLHDLGNIVKFKFDTPLIKNVDKKETEKWKQLQKETIKKYHWHAGVTTKLMAEELAIDKDIIDLLVYAGWENLQKINKSNDWESKICAYADYRVGPFGVISLQERLEDIHKRYSKYKNENIHLKEQYEELERQLFEKINIEPDTITPNSIRPFEVKTV